MSPSDLETAFGFMVKALKLPAPETEYRFHPIRKWRFDFAWVDEKLAVECEGGTWVNGAHSRGAHFESDARKYNAAVELGWRVLRFTSNMIHSGEAIQQLQRVLKERAA